MSTVVLAKAGAKPTRKSGTLNSPSPLSRTARTHGPVVVKPRFGLPKLHEPPVRQNVEAVLERPVPLEAENPSRHLASTRSIPLWKRSLDIALILISLPLTLPCMIAVALWVKAVSRGPALFRQVRIGRNGKRFVLYKFRSMKMNADTRRHENHLRHLVRSDSPMVKLDLLCDSRLIPGGCLLRAAGLDELPQLLNVIRGEMSLVGPRPCLPDEFHFFSPRQRVRFEALPGLTGIWQVSGKGVSTFSEMNAMDALYVRKSSFALDFSIILRTPIALMRQMLVAFQQHRAAGRNAPNLGTEVVES